MVSVRPATKNGRPINLPFHVVSKQLQSSEWVIKTFRGVRAGQKTSVSRVTRRE